MHLENRRSRTERRKNPELRLSPPFVTPGGLILAERRAGAERRQPLEAAMEWVEIEEIELKPVRVE